MEYVRQQSLKRYTATFLYPTPDPPCAHYSCRAGPEYAFLHVDQRLPNKQLLDIFPASSTDAGRQLLVGAALRFLVLGHAVYRPLG